MDFIRHIFLLLTLTFFASVSLPAQENPSYFLHTVEKGQSLYSISSMYGVDQAEIVRLNPGSQEKIYAGQALRIPQAAAQQKGATFHTIQAGETLYKL
ncbi:MAG: LysM peptidoglycan-binding domain-containing protein, partial [Bacteroides sp.]|nr:LysM peptidoglycan-binding domain-containing protein [Bacteroides sp.]